MTWKQNVDDVQVRVPVAADVRGRDVAFEVHPKRLSIKVGGKPVLQGSLADAGAVDPDGGWAQEAARGCGVRRALGLLQVVPLGCSAVGCAACCG